jgi:hypothetical protein
MPFESQKQARFMYAHKNDKGKTGAAARDYIAASHAEGQKVGKLPLRVGAPKVRRETRSTRDDSETRSTRDGGKSDG